MTFKTGLKSFELKLWKTKMTKRLISIFVKRLNLEQLPKLTLRKTLQYRKVQRGLRSFSWFPPPSLLSIILLEYIQIHNKMLAFFHVFPSMSSQWMILVTYNESTWSSARQEEIGWKLNPTNSFICPEIEFGWIWQFWFWEFQSWFRGTISRFSRFYLQLDVPTALCNIHGRQVNVRKTAIKSHDVCMIKTKSTFSYFYDIRVQT